MHMRGSPGGPALVWREYWKEASRCTIQKATYVRFDAVIHTLLLDGASQCLQTLVRTPLGTVAVATVFEERLDQGFEHAFGGQCHNLVFEAAHPRRPTLLTPRLRDIHPALGLRPVAHPFEASGPILEICLQILGIHRLRHLIHAH